MHYLGLVLQPFLRIITDVTPHLPCLHHGQPVPPALRGRNRESRPPSRSAPELEIEGFTRKYKMVRLVYVESTPDVRDAIRREKQIKGWVRAKKLRLVESLNPEWRDLSEYLFECHPLATRGKL